MKEEEFITYWKNLPHTKRKTIVDKSYLILKKRADQHLLQLKIFEKDPTPKDIVHLFGITTIRNFWENCDFLFALGKNKWKGKAHFVIRPIMELTGKLGYFTQQKKVKQEELARVELLKALKKEYEYEIKRAKPSDHSFLENLKYLYKNFKIATDPDIIVSMKEFRKFSSASGFPSDMSQCFAVGKIVEPDLLYTFFDRSSSLLHGNFFSSLTRILPGGFDLVNFLHDAQNALFCGSTVLKITDVLLTGKVQDETVRSIKAFEALHKSGK